MALEQGAGGVAGSNIVPGLGTQTATFTMPSNVRMSIESVVASVASVSASAAYPKLTIRDPSGKLVATVTQARSIPAGDVGNATWALRLAGEGELSGIYFDTFNVGGGFSLETTTTFGPPYPYDISFTSAGNIDLTTADEFNVNGFFGTDMNVTMGQDINLAAQRDVNLGAQRDVNATAAEDGGWLTGGDGTTFSTLSLRAAQAGAFGSQEVLGRDIDLAPSEALTVSLNAGQKLEVRDSGGNPIFRVNEDGSLQGKTGKALTFNL